MNYLEINPNTKTILIESYRKRLAKERKEIVNPINGLEKRLSLYIEIQACKAFLNKMAL